MPQLTLRNFPPELESRLKELARERKWSLNKAAVYLLGKGAGLSIDREAPCVGDSLNAFIGSWTAGEAAAFDRRIVDAFASVDEDLWK